MCGLIFYFSAAMMGWETEKMGFFKPDYVVNGGGMLSLQLT